MYSELSPPTRDEKYFKLWRYKENIGYKKLPLEHTLIPCVRNPSDIFAALKLLDLRNNSGGCIIVVLTENQLVKHDTKANFKNY